MATLTDLTLEELRARALFFGVGTREVTLSFPGSGDGA